jgi:hypothetical protein
VLEQQLEERAAGLLARERQQQRGRGRSPARHATQELRSHARTPPRKKKAHAQDVFEAYNREALEENESRLNPFVQANSGQKSRSDNIREFSRLASQRCRIIILKPDMKYLTLI